MPTAKEKIKVLFVYPKLESYIRRDLDMLERYFNVKQLEADLSIVPRSWREVSVFLQLLREVKWADVVFSWLINLNTFFIEVFRTIWRKKSIIIAGADAVTYVPEIDYGVWRYLKKRAGLKFLLKHPTRVLAVSESNRNEILKHVNSGNIKVVYNGVDVEKFKPSGPKEDLVLTVGAVCYGYLIRKGLETFVKASRYLPHVEFILIGKHEDQSVNYLKSIAGPNVKFPGFVSDEKLLRYYQRAKVYCQLSAHEAFGVALAEAMSCGCVPVVTGRYAIPEVVGDTGFNVPYNKPKETAEMIKKALKSYKGAKARERIKKRFSLQAREEKLVQEILDITK